MIRLNLQTVVVVGLVYWFFFRKKNGGSWIAGDAGMPNRPNGEGYP
jgi:hypothetical protein